MLQTSHAPLRLPEEFRKKLGTSTQKNFVHGLLRNSRLNTVCEEARCPNIAECFSNKTATFMILGDRCTRRCHFCSVKTGKGLPPDPHEPENLVQTCKSLSLDHIVITSVDRDDLDDCGAEHFAKCIRALRKGLPHAAVELLTPDFKGRKELIDIVLAEKPDVFGHNIETVSRLYKQVRPQSNFSTTVSVLEYVAASKSTTVKSGMMVGFSETDDEVDDNLRLLKSVGVQIVTIGQYLRPSLKNWAVNRYVAESSYKRWRDLGALLGFNAIYAGPFVRSSYHAKETFNVF